MMIADLNAGSEGWPRGCDWTATRGPIMVLALGHGAGMDGRFRCPRCPAQARDLRSPLQMPGWFDRHIQHLPVAGSGVRL